MHESSGMISQGRLLDQVNHRSPVTGLASFDMIPEMAEANIPGDRNITRVY
jgi:hypothetical protein